ncbi:MAG TPA: DUF1028 domain-containing protein [Bacteroidales bacterium]|nr:DUF1028 domain-containing protein [Bacteroidales bacterium]HRW96887.1 DUF1028 domain-containing protein [Bacteroidales bacterium]
MRKKRYFLLILGLGIIYYHLGAQDTFSIVAVDTLTGEVGGAGASCIDESAIQGGVLIISDVIPGKGAIHTQSYWNATNQQNAHNRMLEGLSPQEIIDWLIANDVQNNPQIRQYGIVDTDETGAPRSAAFTGINCMDYKNHITGPNYAIQGNILLGQQILDSMEARFLNTEGTLPEKLMAALQGAKVPGADTRCMNEGTSSLSAFISVAKPGDQPGDFWCHLLVPSTPYGVEPIDVLQELFDEWLLWTSISEEPFRLSSITTVAPNPAGNQIVFSITMPDKSDPLFIQILAADGRITDKLIYDGKPIVLNTVKYPEGTYIFTVSDSRKILDYGKFSIIKN